MKSHSDHLSLYGNPEDLTLVHLFIEEWNNELDYIETPTSGTTSQEKLIRISKKNMLNSARATGSFFHFQKGQNTLLCMNPKFIGAKMMILRAMIYEMNLWVVKPSLNPLGALSEHFHFIPMTPVQVQSIISQPIKSKIDTILLGGGGISTQLENKLQSVDIALYHSFAMTETTSHIALRKVNGNDRSELFSCLKGVSVSVDDRNCLLIHAPHLVDEPIQTNDVVKLFSSNSFQWLGRYDHIINTGGIKVNPEIIERSISSFLSERFYIGGLPDSKWGERVVMYIEDQEWSIEKQEALLQQMKAVLPPYTLPKQLIFQNEFEQTATGKIKRKQ